MREIFKSGSVGGAPGNRCLYLEQRTAEKLRFSVPLLRSAAGDAGGYAEREKIV